MCVSAPACHCTHLSCCMTSMVFSGEANVCIGLHRPDRPHTTKASDAEKLTHSAAQATCTIGASPCDSCRNSSDISVEPLLRWCSLCTQMSFSHLSCDACNQHGLLGGHCSRRQSAAEGRHARDERSLQILQMNGVSGGGRRPILIQHSRGSKLLRIYY